MSDIRKMNLITPVTRRRVLQGAAAAGALGLTGIRSAWAQEPATPPVTPAVAGGCQDLSQKLFRSLKTTVDDKSSVAINRQLQQLVKQVSAARDFQLTLRCLMRQNAGG